MTEFFTIDEVSSLLKLHRNTVCRWFKNGVFPNAIDFQGTKRIPQEDIDALRMQSLKKAAI